MKLTRLFPLLILSILLIACNDDDNNETELQPLTFEKESYEVLSEIDNYITIRSGNQHYTITVEDKDILDANPMIFEGSPSPGQIVVKGKKKGQTTITVKDNMTSDEVKLKIKVTDFYIMNRVLKSNHDLFADDQLLFLIKNEKKDFYIYSVNNTQDKFSLSTKGNYEFLFEDQIPYLRLSYEDAGKENKTYKFDIKSSDEGALSLYNNYFELGWYSQRNTSPVQYLLKLKNQDTEVSLVISFSAFMPEGVLE